MTSCWGAVGTAGITHTCGHLSGVSSEHVNSPCPFPRLGWWDRSAPVTCDPESCHGLPPYEQRPTACLWVSSSPALVFPDPVVSHFSNNTHIRSSLSPASAPWLGWCGLVSLPPPACPEPQGGPQPAVLCHTSSPHLHSSLWPGVSSSCSKLFLIFQGFKFPSCAPKTGLGLPGGSPGTPRTALFSSSWGTRDFISLTDLSLPMAGAMPESRDLGSTGLWSRGPQRSPSPPWHTGTRGFLYCAFEKRRLREATEHAKVTHLAWQALVALAGCRGAGGGRGTAVPMLAVHVQTVSRSRARVGDFSLALTVKPQPPQAFTLLS